MDIGRVGIWTNRFETQPWPVVKEGVAALDEMGFGAIWFPESRGREAIAQSALLLGASRRVVVAPGIANIYARDAMAMAAAHKTLSEAYPGRFLLGIGVSHRPNVEGLRGHRYGPPLRTMRDYLDAMDRALYVAPAPPAPPRRVLAALGPKMLELSRDRADGAHPYFTPPEHTALARQILGPGPLLAPEQAVVIETDRTRAREIARAHMAGYLRLENYTNNLRRLGYGDADLADGGSDRLVDAIVAWGGLDAVCARVRAHLDAGADHVCIQVLNTLPPAAGEPPPPLPLAEWRALAGALLS